MKPSFAPCILRLTGISTVAAMLLVVGCGAPSNNDSLFDLGGARAGSGNAGGGSPSLAGSGGMPGTADGRAHGGSGNAGAAHGGSTNGGSSTAGAPNGGTAGTSGGGTAGTSGGGTAGTSGGGTAGTSGGGTAGTNSTGGAGGQGNIGGGGSPSSAGSGGSGTSDCSLHDAQAKYLAQTGHCYLADAVTRNFAAAQAHCMDLGAHLITIASALENDFAWGVQKTGHWIGATDGKDRTTPLSGTYVWVTGEPFTFTAWSTNQPNATPGACNGGGTCYEHCASQAIGPGLWNDRICDILLPSICEWEN